MPNEHVYEKSSDHTVMIEKKKKEHMPTTKKTSLKGNTMIFAFGFF